MWKYKLRMSKSTHLVMDFQDIAWYISTVYFKTPDVQSFFSEYEHFECSQFSVATFAYANDDDWEIDYHRRELIRHHKTHRSQLFKIEGSKCPIPFDDLESTRKPFIEMKNGTKKVEEDNWRAVSGPEKRLDKQWRGRTVFKIKSGVELPGDLSHVKSSSKIPRISDPSDKVKPEHLPAGEISEKPKSSSSTDDADKSRGPDSSGTSRRLSRKTTAVAKDDYKDFQEALSLELHRALEFLQHLATNVSKNSQCHLVLLQSIFQKHNMAKIGLWCQHQKSVLRTDQSCGFGSQHQKSVYIL